MKEARSPQLTSGIGNRTPIQYNPTTEHEGNASPEREPNLDSHSTLLIKSSGIHNSYGANIQKQLQKIE